MTHTIKFNSVQEMWRWLIENEIDNMPVDLTLHIPEES